MASTRAMFEPMEARPFSRVSGVTPRFDCRICSIEWIAARGLDTSWHTPATMKPSEARRCICALTVSFSSLTRRP